MKSAFQETQELSSLVPWHGLSTAPPLTPRLFTEKCSISQRCERFIITLMADEDSKLFDSLERESKEFDKVSR